MKGLYVISGSGKVSALDSAYAISGSGKVAAVEDSRNDTAQDQTANGGTAVVSGKSYTFAGAGWGHQLGMSQYGAYAMAQRGFTYDEIVEFYYPGVSVRNKY